MSVKHFNEGEWKIFPGTIGAPGKDAYTIAQENGYSGTKEEYTEALVKVPIYIKRFIEFEDTIDEFQKNIEDFKKEVITDIDDMNTILYNQYSEAILTSNTSKIETGADTNVAITINTLFNGNPIIPTKLILKRGETILSEDINLRTYNDTITTEATYTLYVELYPTISKTVSIVVNSYYPMYFGSSIKSTIASSDILTFSKQPINKDPRVHTVIDIKTNEYIWLCVPSTMAIHNLVSLGFDVPLEEKIDINLIGKTTYKCYRSSDSFLSGTFKGIII